jgi:hypothetical protein
MPDAVFSYDDTSVNAATSARHVLNLAKEVKSLWEYRPGSGKNISLC